jgi:hypothetical protein
MVEVVEALVAGTVEAVAISVAAAISVAGISLGLLGVVLAAIVLWNTEEGISSTGIASCREIISGTEIVSGTIAISFLEVPSCMTTPTTTGMIIRTTSMMMRTTDIIIHTRTDIAIIDMVRTTAFAASRF